MRIPQTPERIKEAPAQALRAVFAGVGQVLLMTERIRRRAIGQEHSRAVSTGGLDTGDAPAPAGGNGAHTATLGADQADQADQVKTGTAGTSTVPTSAAKVSTAKTSTAKATTAKTSTAKAEPAKTKAASAKAGAPKTVTAQTGTAKASSAKATATTKPSDATADTAPAETAVPAQLATVAEAAAPAPSEAVITTQAPQLADSAEPEVRGTGVLPVPHYSELSIASLRARLRGLDIVQVRDLLTYERTHEDRANVIAMFERRIAKLEEAEGADPAAG